METGMATARPSARLRNDYRNGTYLNRNDE